MGLAHSYKYTLAHLAKRKPFANLSALRIRFSYTCSSFANTLPSNCFKQIHSPMLYPYHAACMMKFDSTGYHPRVKSLVMLGIPLAM